MQKQPYGCFFAICRLEWGFKRSPQKEKEEPKPLFAFVNFQIDLQNAL